jgi:peptide/nickel transport system substrate-binding protein
MNNRFGLKDAAILGLLAVVLIVLFLQMVQRDRMFLQQDSVMGKLSGLEQQVARLENKVDKGASTPPSIIVQPSPVIIQQMGGGGGVQTTQGVAVPAESGASAGAAAPAASSSSAAATGSVLGDEAWPRPGAPVKRQPPVGVFSDATKMPGFGLGGEITEIFEAQLKTLTPQIATDVYARRIHELVLESLGRLNPQTLEVEGLLAEAWQVDPNGLWLRARLRNGVRFSDGKPITAEDFRWTYHEYILNEGIDAERVRSIYRDSIKKVSAIDDRTVEFEFFEPLFTNVDNALGMFVLPKHVYATQSPAQINASTGLLVGSGPFRLANFDVNRQWAPPAAVVLERNEQYWGPKPTLDTLRYEAINEEIARLNSFRKGDADIITPSAPQFVSKREDKDWKETTQFLQWVNMRSGYSFIAWNCGNRNGVPTPFVDKRVRRAMTLLLDREQMMRDIWKGVGQVAKGNQPIGSPGENKQIKPWPFDPVAGLALLKEAGWEDRDGNGVLENDKGAEFEFEFSYAGGSEISERVAKFVKDAYTNAGIKVSLRSSDWSVYQDLMKKRDFDAITLGWGANAPESDPRQIFHSSSIQNQGDNFAQWANADADRLIDAGRRELDPAKRAKIWQELEKVLHEEGPYTFVRSPPWLRIVSTNVGNITKFPAGLLPQEYFRVSGAAVPKPTN